MVKKTSPSRCDETSTSTPPEFICCLTLDILSDPVTTPKGFTFERKAITKWLIEGDGTCPLTREPLEDFELANNNDLREEIIRWKKSKGIKTSKMKTVKDAPVIQSKVLECPRLISVRERVLKRREQQFQAHLSARC